MTSADVRARAYQLRERGCSYSLIEKTLGIPYSEARLLGKAYDASHGKPQTIVRRIAAEPAGQQGTTTIPVRDLRNNSARILRQVEHGRRFLITVSGKQVAALVPIDSRSTFVPASVIEAIRREAPLDQAFARDLRSALSQRVDDI